MFQKIRRLGMGLLLGVFGFAAVYAVIFYLHTGTAFPEGWGWKYPLCSTATLSLLVVLMYWTSLINWLFFGTTEIRARRY